MQTALSPEAVAVLRFEIKGYRSRTPSRRRAAYRELAAAGIMEPVPGSDAEYRFTEDGMRNREAILEREAERIERRALRAAGRRAFRSGEGAIAALPGGRPRGDGGQPPGLPRAGRGTRHDARAYVRRRSRGGIPADVLGS